MLRPALLLALVATPAAAGTIHVHGALATGANDGTSWANAYRGADALQVALQNAVWDDQIWVAAGTYRPTTTNDRRISFRLKDRVGLYGGFLGYEQALGQRNPDANPTILSGDIGVSGDASDNSFHVVLSGSPQAPGGILDGFTVTLGNADGTGANEDRGGGILCNEALSVTVRNSRFVRNRATTGGGGGFGNRLADFANVVFEGNTSPGGGGAYQKAGGTTHFTGCEFVGNRAGRGGALDTVGNQTLYVFSSVFRGNAATGVEGGGAIAAATSLIVGNCTITENVATASEAGGVVCVNFSRVVENSIVWGNRGASGGQATVNQISGAQIVAYSIVEGGHPGPGNLAAAPLFLDAANGDYRVALGSPAIDAGRNSAESAHGTDLAGERRVVDVETVPDSGIGGPPVVDIGAFESPAPSVWVGCHGDYPVGVCPCGNESPLLDGHGCRNSLGTGGQLHLGGTARLSGDTVVLSASGMTNSSCLYFQGTAGVAGIAWFGDGRACVTGSLVRLGVKQNSAGASQYPGVGDPSISVRGLVTSAGSVRVYQCWYRDVAAFCTPAAFNTTSLVGVQWEF